MLRRVSGLERTPAAFMTAKVMQSEIAGYEGLAALGVIAKPFDPMTLADQVRALWECRED